MMKYRTLGTFFDRVFRNDLNTNFSDIDNDIKFVESKSKQRNDAIQSQINTLVVEGDSSVEAAQARVKADGTVKTTLKERLDESDAQLAQTGIQVTDLANKAVKREDFTNFQTIPYNPMPPKQGLKTCSTKIVHKTDDDEFTVIQRANKDYLRYLLNTKNGGTGPTDIGGSYELVRLKQVERIKYAYAWWFEPPTTGTLGVQREPGQTPDQERWYFGGSFTGLNPVSSDGTGNGYGQYIVDASQSVTFTMRNVQEHKMNLLFSSSFGSSESVDILVNGVVVKNFNARAYRPSSGGNYSIVEFETSRNHDDQTTYTIQVRNNDVTNPFYLCCFNFYELDRYNGARVNNHKYYRTGVYFLNSVGASDYAFREKRADGTEMSIGSYHGGEVRTYDRALWNIRLNARNVQMREFVNIPSNEWRLQESFTMWQRTNIDNRGTMVSIFDFNTDGTMEMKFALSDFTIPTINFHTALTTTHKNFEWVTYPRQEQISINGTRNYPNAMGELTQYDVTNLLELNIRYTTFHRFLNEGGSNIPYITNNASYSKFYYGLMLGAETPVTVRNITFSKGLDFIVRQ